MVLALSVIPASLETALTHATAIEIRVNEHPQLVADGATMHDVRQTVKPDADVLIRNGFPVNEHTTVVAGDEVILIRRGEMPKPEELEALLVSRHGPEVHRKLKRGHVGIAGCGGLGSTVAVALARSGVGKLTLVDFDVVEPSNLNRQQFFVDQIGLPKVEALTANLRRINPYVCLESHLHRLTKGDVTRLFSNCSVVAECFDDPSAKAELSSAMRRFLPNTPLVVVSGIAGYGPASAITCRRVFGNHFLVGDGVTAAEPGRGLLAPKVTVAAGYQANVVLRLLLGAISNHEGD